MVGAEIFPAVELSTACCCVTSNVCTGGRAADIDTAGVCIDAAPVGNVLYTVVSVNSDTGVLTLGNATDTGVE